MSTEINPPIRIQIYIDGRSLYLVSNHYRFDHPVNRHINMRGIQDFLQAKVAKYLETDLSNTIMSRCHMFIGTDMDKREELYETLKKHRIKLHWHILAMRDGFRKEIGVDVGLATSAISAAYEDKMDVMVLLSADGDFYPLIKQVQRLGKKVVLAYWDLLPSPNRKLSKRITTSNSLLREAEFLINMREEMHTLLESKDEAVILQLFKPKNEDVTTTEAEVYREASITTPPEENSVPVTKKELPPGRHRGTVIEKGSTVIYIRSESATKRKDKNYLVRSPGNAGMFDSLEIGTVVEYGITSRTNKFGGLVKDLTLVM